jgi:hypothetical protein
LNGEELNAILEWRTAVNVNMRVNGALLERWFLKTLINILFDRSDDDVKWTPPDAWVKCAFGLSAFPDRCGFHVLAGNSVAFDHGYTTLGFRILTDARDDVIKHTNRRMREI